VYNSNQPVIDRNNLSYNPNLVLQSIYQNIPANSNQLNSVPQFSTIDHSNLRPNLQPYPSGISTLVNGQANYATEPANSSNRNIQGSPSRPLNLGENIVKSTIQSVNDARMKIDDKDIQVELEISELKLHDLSKRIDECLQSSKRTLVISNKLSQNASRIMSPSKNSISSYQDVGLPGPNEPQEKTQSKLPDHLTLPEMSTEDTNANVRKSDDRIDRMLQKAADLQQDQTQTPSKKNMRIAVVDKPTSPDKVVESQYLYSSDKKIPQERNLNSVPASQNVSAKKKTSPKTSPPTSPPFKKGIGKTLNLPQKKNLDSPGKSSNSSTPKIYEFSASPHKNSPGKKKSLPFTNPYVGQPKEYEFDEETPMGGKDNKELRHQLFSFADQSLPNFKSKDQGSASNDKNSTPSPIAERRTSNPSSIKKRPDSPKIDYSRNLTPISEPDENPVKNALRIDKISSINSPKIPGDDNFMASSVGFENATTPNNDSKMLSFESTLFKDRKPNEVRANQRKDESKLNQSDLRSHNNLSRLGHEKSYIDDEVEGSFIKAYTSRKNKILSEVDGFDERMDSDIYFRRRFPHE